MSIYTPNIRKFVFDCFVSLFTMIGIFILNRFGLRIKSINSYFFGAKMKSWRYVHFSHNLCNYFNIFILFFVLMPYTNILMLSKNLNAFVGVIERLQIFNNSTLQYKYNINEIGNFCGTFALIAKKNRHFIIDR